MADSAACASPTLTSAAAYPSQASGLPSIAAGGSARYAATASAERPARPSTLARSSRRLCSGSLHSPPLATVWKGCPLTSSVPGSPSNLVQVNAMT